MIQRIQTVYLLVVAILMVVMMSLPVGSFVAADYTAIRMEQPITLRGPCLPF